jgi:hypothetical protein
MISSDYRQHNTTLYITVESRVVNLDSLNPDPYSLNPDPAFSKESGSRVLMTKN